MKTHTTDHQMSNIIANTTTLQVIVTVQVSQVLFLDRLSVDKVKTSLYGDHSLLICSYDINGITEIPDS